MKIMFNQQWLTVPCQVKLSDLLAIVDVKEPHFAVAVNYQFVSKYYYSTHTLYDNDIVDIIVPMQGG